MSGNEYDALAVAGRRLCGREAVDKDFTAEMEWHRLRSAPGVTLRPSDAADCAELSVTMRAEDFATVAELVDADPLKSLQMRLGASSHALTALDKHGYVICMFGLASMGDKGASGAPWLVGSDLIENHRVLFARLSKKYLAAMLQLYPVLENAVDARKTNSVRWLRWLGFDVGPALPLGKFGAPFRPYMLKRANASLR